MRVTATRASVLRVLDESDESDDHPRVDQIIEHVRASGVSIPMQAMYDVCEALTITTWSADPAGLAIDVDCVVARRSCLERSDPQGFDVDEAEVTYWGLCPSCQHDNAEGMSA